MWFLVSGVLVFLVPSLWAVRRAKRELESLGRLRRSTFAAVFVAYVGHAAITLLATWRSAWPLPLHQTLALAIGAVVALVGAIIYITARVQFRSFLLTWGLATSRLITTGIYRFSRNPQVGGALIFLLGCGLAGRSGVALALVFLLGVASLVWIPLEEEVLERRFGQLYEEYRSHTHRFVGFPRRHRSFGDSAV